MENLIKQAIRENVVCKANGRMNETFNMELNPSKLFRHQTFVHKNIERLHTGFLSFRLVFRLKKKFTLGNNLWSNNIQE